MADPLAPADPGLLSSVLNAASLPGYALRNLLRGEGAAAGRNVVDLIGNAADALVPGDWLSDISAESDKPDFRDVVDLGGDSLGTDILNFVGNVATDPISYIPGAAVAKAGTLAKTGVGKAVSALPKGIQDPLRKGAETVGRKVRSIAGAQRVSAGTQKAIAAKQAAADLVGRSGAEGGADALAGLTERELRGMGEVGHNMRLDPATGLPVRLLDDSEELSFDQRLAKLLQEEPGLDPQRMLAAAPKFRQTLATQWDVAQQPASSPGGGVFFNRGGPGTPDVVMGGMSDVPSAGVRDYFPRQFSGMKADGLDEISGLPKPIAERADWRDRDILDYLLKNPEVRLEFDAAKALSQRMGTQGELAGRAQVGHSLFERARAGEVEVPDELLAKFLPKSQTGYKPADMMGAQAPGTLAQGGRVASEQADVASMMGGAKPRPPEAGAAPILTDFERKQAKDWLLSQDFKLADPDLRSAATAIAKQFPEEEATVLLNALNGMAPRGAITGALAKLNTYFKGAAVFGAVLPKLGSITRNLTGGLFQQMANAEARGDTLRAAVQVVPNWLKSVDDGIEQLFGARLGPNEFADVDAAFKGSMGDPRKALAGIKDDLLRGAVQRGVLGNTFVSTEQLVNSAAKGGWKSFGKNLLTYPAAMFKGAETRMRYGLYKSLIGKGVSEDEAARIVTDTFFDYSISGADNRMARDVIPFAQFLFKAIPSQAKFLAEKPVALSAVANLQGDGEGPVYPWMQGKVNIPVGQDEQGNQQFLSNLGLPVEAISAIPNLSADPLDFGRQVEQTVVGSSQPLLKAAYSLISGRDPYFGSQYGSYGKLPIVGEAGALGRAVNPILGLGLPGGIQASSVLGTLGKASDDRTNLAEKMANLLTGAKVVSVDESRALQQTLENALKRDPSIAQYTTLNNRSDDEGTQALLDALKKAKSDIKAKQAATTPVN